PVLHHRRPGSATLNVLNNRFRQGIVEYSLGYHPFFQAMKCLFRMKEKPYVIGSLFRFIGFWYTMLRHVERPVSKDFIRFIRKEQIERIKKIMSP
ncbi:MAG: hypothetical protein ACM3MI_04200, partial [Clostridiales bacterium]